jgi:hypothetical protein
LRQVLVNELRRQIKHDRGVDLIAVHGLPLTVKEVRKIDAENVHDADPRYACDHGCKRFLMWIVPVSRKQNEFTHPGCLPRVEEVVEHPVQGLFPQRSVPRESALRVDIHSILHRWSPQHAIFCGKIVGHSLDNDRIAAEGKVRPMLLASPDRDYEARIVAENGADLSRIELLDPKGSGIRQGGGKSHRITG